MYLKTSDFIQKLKDKYHLTSDYQVAKFLNLNPNTVYNWTKGKNTLDDHSALIIAQALEVDPIKIITCCQIERAEKRHDYDVAGIYRNWLHKLEGPAVTGVTAVFTVFFLNGIVPF